MPEIPTTLTVPLFAGFGIVIIILLAWVIRLEVKLRRLLAGANARSLEDTIAALVNGQKEFRAFQTELEQHTRDIESRLSRSVQAVETVRFNAFKGTGSGGDQSFATALITEEGDGVVLLGLFARERVSVFAKPIAAFTPQYELSDEEAEALARAKRALAKKSETA